MSETQSFEIGCFIFCIATLILLYIPDFKKWKKKRPTNIWINEPGTAERARDLHKMCRKRADRGVQSAFIISGLPRRVRNETHY